MSVLQDVRFAVRTFARNPGLVAAVAVSIGLGVAANATVFSLVNTLLLGQLPVREPSRVVVFSGGTHSWPDYVDYREGTRDVLEDISAHFILVPASMGGGGDPERLWGQMVSANYFPVVGPEMALGRGFTKEEDQRGGRTDVVVLTHGLWKRRFGADPAVIGKRAVLNNKAFEVVGVTGPGFHGTERGLLPEFFVPLANREKLLADFNFTDMEKRRNAQWVVLHGRLKEGVSREQAQAAVNVIKQRIDNTHRKNDRKRPPISLDPAGGVFGDIRRMAVALLSVLMAVVGLVLMIACANVANLLLARAAGRQKEIGIRMAMGAGRGRLAVQLLTESVLLAVLGAAFGLWLAFAATRVLSQFEPPFPIPLAFDFTPDLRVFAFTAALAVFTGVLFGVAPALRATRPDLMTIMKEDSGALGTFRRFGLRNGLVVVQVALSLVLLIGAMLFLRSMQNATSIDLGMKTDNVLLLAFDPKLHQYSKEKTVGLIDQLRERVSAMPGVQSVSYVDSIPLSIGGTSFDLKAAGKANAQSVNADIYNVGQRYFETLGIPVIRGREFDRQRDANGAIVINEKLAREMFGSAEPLGQQIAVQGMNNAKELLEIVGIVRNSKSRTIGEEPQNMAYMFLESAPEKVMSLYGISIVVRTSVPPRRLEPAVRAEVHKLDANMPVFGIVTLQEHVNKSMLLPRLCAALLGVFGTVGLILATVGLYGVISYSVRSRTREIGIRIALGAETLRVVRMVVRQGLALVVVGLVAGLGLAFALTRFTASLLYGISTTDIVTFIGVPAAMVLVAVAAIILPARRAATVDPIQALHYE